MRTLAVLLIIAGFMATLAFGLAGYIAGPLAMLLGAWLLRSELHRRKEVATSPAVQAPPAIPRRPGWQRFLIAVAAVLVGFIGLFALIWRLTAGLADTADAFFIALKSGDLDAARGHLSEEFRASTTDEQLRRFVQRSALANYESASWSNRSIENSRGELIGTVETADGGQIPMTVSLIREQGEWKILALRKPSAGLLGDDPREQPSPAEQVRLTQETTQWFADAVTQRDFSEFRLQTSAMWQKQSTVEQLNDGFKAFADANIDLSPLKGAEPRIRSAAFDTDGAFAIIGNYPLGSASYDFRYRFVFEGTDWKLVGVSANVR